MPDKTESAVLLQTELPGVTLLARGKVRDVYALGDKLLIVASDRISAFDYILATGIPGKGRILTQLSVFWFDFLRDVTPTHFIAANVDEYPEALRAYRGQLEGRSMLVKRAKMMDVECVVRGYLAGSGWNEYRETGRVCGISLPPGLKESDRLPEPIFTPSTKAQTGHDENIPFEKVVGMLGADLANRLRGRDPGDLSQGGVIRRDAGRDHRRHEVRVRPRRRSVDPGRRGAYAGLFALLAFGNLPAGRPPAVLR